MDDNGTITLPGVRGVVMRRGRRGMMLVYVALMTFVIVGFISLAVDYGRVQAAKEELQSATDAAAAYGAMGASDGTYSAKAITSASENTVDGSPLVLQAGDIQAITYDTTNHTYSVGGASPNGVKVSAQRSASRGTGLTLYFARLLGRSTLDMHATAIAVYTSGMPDFGVVGVSAVMLQNNTILVDSYSSSSGSYGGANILNHGYVATNGGMTLTGGVTINNDIYMRAGQSLTANGSPNYNSRQVLGSALSYTTTASYPGSATLLGNVNSGTTLGSGASNTDYYSTGVNINSGQTLTINGPVTLYVNGNFTINGTVTVTGNKATNFKVRMMSGAGVNLTTATIYADIFAPSSPVNIGTGTSLYGRIIGSQLSVNGSANIHYDEALPALPGTAQGPSGGGGGSGGSVSIED